MKKLYAIAALAAVLVGCAKEVEDPNAVVPETGNTVTLRASVDNPDTKMQADNVGTFAWQTGDVISVLNNSGEAFDFSTTGSGSTVDFTGTFASGSLGDYAMYPKHDDHEAAGDVVSFHLPTSLDWAANTTFMPMLGKIADGKASFKAVGGVLKLVCYNIPSGAVLFQFSATNKQINGEFVIDGSEASPAIETDDKAGSNNETEIDFTGNYSANKVFYIPLPTGTIDGFTVSFFDSGANELFSKTTTANLVVGRNKIILGPALNCDADIRLWSEDFSVYSSGNIPADTDIAGYGVNNITYVCVDGGSDTKVYEQNIAEGTSPELLVGKSSGTFTVSNLPTDGASSLTLKYKTNAKTLNLSSSTDGVSFSPSSTSTKEEHTITISNSKGASTFDIVFAAGTDNVRLDDLLLIKPGAAASTPSLTPADAELTIPVGSLSANTTITYANKVDEMEIGVSSSESWLTPTLTGSYPTYTLTATASGANNGAADRTATITLSAAGVKKTIDVTQTTCLVPNPTVSVIAGDAKFSASWTGVEHATSYVAYLHTAVTATPATGGNDISASITESAGVYSITDYAVANGTYYLYVKVNGVSSGYEVPSAYVEETFTCEEAKGTAENPYWANELYTAIAAGTVSGATYVKGYVSYANNPSSNTQTYFISNDGTGDNSGTLQIYQGKGIGGANITSSNRVNVGDWVVVSGDALYFNSSKPEINSGNVLVTHYFLGIDYDEVEWAWNETSAEDFTVSINASGVYKTFTHSESGMDWATVSVAGNVITITPKDNNESLVADREGTVTIHHTSDLLSDIVISCKQTKAPAHSITIDSKTSLTVDLNGDHTQSTVLDVVSVYSPWSVKTVTGDSAADGFTYSVNTSTNKLTITPKADNTGSKREGIGTIVLTDSSNGDLCTITLNQATKAAVSVVASMASICSATTYGTYDDGDWVVTCGSSNGSFGCNSSGADSKMKLGSYYVVATPLDGDITNTSTHYAALISKDKLPSGITTITLSGTLGTGMTVGVTVSSDGTTWTKLADFGSDTDFSFSSQPSQYYAIVIHAANKSNARYTGFSAEFSE